LRKNHQEQLPLVPAGIDHEHAKELEVISDVLDANLMIGALAAQDLASGIDPMSGRNGMTGDQVVRAALLRQMNGWSYEELAFHLADSVSCLRFCRIGIADVAPKKSTLADNIKRLLPQTWESIHQVVVDEAKRRGVERGNQVRMDCTVVESPIHEPSDSSLLFDVVRVLARLLGQAKRLCGIEFSDRCRRAKRRMLGVRNAKNKAQRKRPYRDLIRVTKETLHFVDVALPRLDALDPLPAVRGLVDELKHFAALGWQVVEQTHLRVFEQQSVSASDKIVSIFEAHTDIIVKDRRETLYGHKVCLSTGASSMVLDLKVLDGNPADATLVELMIDRHTMRYGKAPRQAAFDGGFASKANVEAAKASGVHDVCFSKRRGIEITDMVKSAWVFKKLKRFRAGVEGCISWLKRCFGMDRCRWRGLTSFHSYAWASVVTCNLLILARHALR
jgi:IS5 family transposase|tara:strand:- start:139 stop:1476 length:1338 start_codon:yes stop_codon:yes gene_type:complete